MSILLLLLIKDYLMASIHPSILLFVRLLACNRNRVAADLFSLLTLGTHVQRGLQYSVC